jgi:hemerythrin superfamily protein
MSVVEKVKSYIGVYDGSDIRALLHADHEQIRALTEEISSDASTQKRVRAFDQLKPFLTAHARAEEQAVYIPLVNLRGSPDSRADGNEGFVEHSLVDVLVERLSKTDLAATDAWKAHAQVLQETLDHHIKEEERGIFGELGEHFTDEQRDAMGADFVARKEKLLLADRSQIKKAA